MEELGQLKPEDKRLAISISKAGLRFVDLLLDKLELGSPRVDEPVPEIQQKGHRLQEANHILSTHEAIEEYLESKRSAQCSPNSIKSYKTSPSNSLSCPPVLSPLKASWQIRKDKLHLTTIPF